MKIDGNSNAYLTPDLAAEAAKRGAAASPVIATDESAEAAPSAIVHQGSESQAALQLYDRLAQMPKPAQARNDNPVVTPEGAAELLKRALSGMGGLQAEGKLDTLVSRQWMQALAGD
jgi:hypothetical protein